MAFYDDGNYRSKEEAKKRLTLDLNKVNSPRAKKPRFDVLLSSPDLNMLKLPSPELEKLIMQQNGLLSTTPNSSQFLYPNPRIVTHDQEMYGRGFDDALAELHQNGAAVAAAASGGGASLAPPTTTSAPSNHSNNYAPVTIETAAATTAHTTFTTHNPPPPVSAYSGTLQIPVKEEPRCGTSLSSSPPMSPIDMENQERIKLERKRQRNRIAASKCRRRKLERIAKLEDKVKLLKNDNSELATVVVKLRQQVCGLKEQVMEHVNCGCHILLGNQF